MAKGPEAGWYPNPEAAHEVRWWDGEQWTAHTERNPMASVLPPAPTNGPSGPTSRLPSGGSGLRPVSDWLSETFSLIGSRIGHLFTLALLLGLLPNLLYAVVVYLRFRDVEIRLLPDETGWEGTVGTGWKDTGIQTIDLVLVGVALLVSQLLGTVMLVAVCRQVQLAKVGLPELWSDSLGPSFKRAFRVLGIQLLVGLMIATTFILVVVVAIVVHPATFVLTVPAFLIGLLYFGTRLSLAVPAAAVAPKGVGSLANSYRLSAGRFVPLLGRLVLLAIVGFFGSMILSTLAQVAGPSNALVLGPDAQPIEILNFETIFGSNPAGFFLSIVLGGLGNSLLLGLMLSGMTLLYNDLGGEMAEDLKQPLTDSLDG